MRAAPEDLDLSDCFRLLLESLPRQAVVIFDTEGRVTRWNPGAQRMFGWGEPEIVGQPAAVLFTPEDRAAGIPELEMRTATENGYSNDDRWHMRKDGSRLHVTGSMNPVCSAQGEPRGFIKLMRDDTDAVALLDRLKLAQSAGSMGAYDWIVPENRLIWTRELEALYGFPPGGFDGSYQAWAQRVLPEDLPGVERNLRDALAGKSEPSMEFRIRRIDGAVRWLAARGTVHRDFGGRAYRMVGINIDITERKEGEQRLVQANRELEQFAYIASHDLQEPLRMIGSYLGLLQRKYASHLDARANEYIGFAVDGAARMQKLIRQLLEYAKLERAEPNLADIDSGRALTEALEVLRPRIASSGASVTHGQLPRLRADSDLLARLFQNLISNAIKYSSKARAPQVRVEAERGDSAWLFAVRDNGIGIAPADRERVFAVFQRLHTRDEYPGTGLGLAICKRIVDRHGGRLWVESTPGEGSTFHFTIPDAPPAETSSASGQMGIRL
jgi:PAS domain S-box-containing protein